VTDHPAYAIIHVKESPSCDAWPIVERVPGGWSSGVHHYEDSRVIDLTPLHLVPDHVTTQWGLRSGNAPVVHPCSENAASYGARMTDQTETAGAEPVVTNTFELLDAAAERGYNTMFEGDLPTEGIERALWHKVALAILDDPKLLPAWARGARVDADNWRRQCSALDARLDAARRNATDAERIANGLRAERDELKARIERLRFEVENWTLPVGALQQMSDAVNLVPPVSDEDDDVPHSELRARRAMDVVYEWLRGIRGIPAALHGDQPAETASPQAWTQDDRSGEASVQAPPTVDSGEDVAKLPDPNGCRHCDAPERGHYRRYTDGVGWHQWAVPDDTTRLARMYARRAATHPGGQVWPPGSGADDTIAFRTPPPAPFVPAADAFPEVTDG